jgi:hypothetical protein
MELRITIEELKNKGLTLTQYIYLWGLYNQVKVKYLDVQEEALSNLIDRYYITKNGNEYILLDNSIELFEPSGGLFDEFIKTFPTRVKNINGETRILSPASFKSAVGQKMKKKWHSITKNNIELQTKLLACLKEEIKMREKEGSLYWMRGIEPWLNKATWEDYEYLLDGVKKQESTGFKPSEIRL